MFRIQTIPNTHNFPTFKGKTGKFHNLFAFAGKKLKLHRNFLINIFTAVSISEITKISITYIMAIAPHIKTKCTACHKQKLNFLTTWLQNFFCFKDANVVEWKFKARPQDVRSVLWKGCKTFTRPDGCFVQSVKRVSWKFNDYSSWWNLISQWICDSSHDQINFNTFGSAVESSLSTLVISPHDLKVLRLKKATQFEKRGRKKCRNTISAKFLNSRRTEFLWWLKTFQSKQRLQ